VAWHASLTDSQDFRTYRLGAQEAAAALAELARARRSSDPEVAQWLLTLGRHLGTPCTLDAAMDASRRGVTAETGLPLGLQMRADDVVGVVASRLLEAESLVARRVHFAILIALGGCEGLREALADQLNRLLGHAQWFAVRNAVTLLSAIGAGVPRRRWRPLAASPHRQVRLAVAQELARRTADDEARTVLISLLDDADEGVRYTAAVALGENVGAQARQALLRRARVEIDAEVAGRCTSSLRRPSQHRMAG